MTPLKPILPLCVCGDLLCKIPYGYCHCRCGTQTALAPRTRPKLRQIKGMPHRFALGHGSSSIRPQREDAMPFKIDGEPCRVIFLTHGCIALVDASDYEWLSRYRWWASAKRSGVYAVRTERGKKIYMHREIMQTPADEICDHARHNTVDNRRSQLRNCTESKNSSNMKMHKDNPSGYKGVFFNNQRGRYTVTIMHKGKARHQGCFDDPIKAAAAYDMAAIQYHGDFAHLNFPKEDYK